MKIKEINKVASFKPAIVKESARDGLLIEYYVFDPTTEKMVRQRNQLNRLLKPYRTKREKRLEAQRVADEINANLQNGWSPFHTDEDTRLYTPISELREKFLSYKKKEGCRESTLTTYAHHTERFVKWCEDKGKARKYSGTFRKMDAVRYMDDVLDSGNSNRHYGNVIKNLRAFFGWAESQMYCKENPFEHIKALPNEKKRRILVDSETRGRIRSYLLEKDPQYLLVLLLIYHSAMRPKEIANIKLGDINISNHYIIVREEVAKNKKQRCATITRDIEQLLLPILQQWTDVKLYLFGSCWGCTPCKEKVSLSRFRKKWDKLRAALSLPNEMQMYSFRDSGISDLIHAGVDQLTVQHHADHSSLAVQQIYTDHFDPELTSKIYNKSPEF